MRHRHSGVPTLVTLAFMATAVMATDAAAQAGRLGGVIRDETGQGIKGATITLENPDASPRSLTATTDDKGRFGVIGLRSGEWSVLVQSPGFLPEAARAVVRVATVPALAFTLKKAPAPPPSALGSVAAKDLQTDLRAADQFFNMQQWDQAISAYKAILARAPALSVISLQIGAAYRNKKDYDNALVAYNDLLRVDSNSDKAKIGIGQTYIEKGDLQAAEDILGKAAQSPTASKEVFYNLGEVEFAKVGADKGDIDEAIKWYQRASVSDPNWGKPLLKLGLCALNKGERETASRMMQRVLEVDPTSPEALQAKAVIDQLQKQK